MSEENNKDVEQQEQMPILILGQYVKDLSFEIPQSYKIFEKASENQPSLSVGVDIKVAEVNKKERTYEVTLDLNVESDIKEDKAFILEISYSGIFNLNVPEEALDPILNIECSRLLFPYARSIISSVTAESGFPPVVLAPIDFAGLYQQRMEQTKKEEENKKVN